MNEEQTATPTATTHTISTTTVTDTGAIATLLMHAVPENTVRNLARQMETGIAHHKAETAIRAALGLKRCGAKVEVAITIED
jgi:hypothetical protein